MPRLFCCIALCTVALVGSIGGPVPLRSQDPAIPADRVFLDAVGSHDIVRLAELLNKRSPARIDALMEVAIEQEDPAAVRLLLRYGANPNSGIGGGTQTPLMAAARVGCSEVIDVLLKAGADPNGRAGFSTKVSFPLLEAVRGGHRRATNALLAAKADPNARSGFGHNGLPLEKVGLGTTPLMEAAALGDPIIVELLISHGADPSLLDDIGRRAIDWLEESKRSVEEIRRMLR
jgi:ankyrin repeat protein